MIAIYPGSFSPPTRGHQDIIRRAALLFDQVIVAVMGQSAKAYALTYDQRLAMMEKTVAGLSNVRVLADDGLLVDLAHRVGANVILRGLRSSADLTYEMQMAEANRKLGNLQTLYMGCAPEYSMISSTIVRDCVLHGARIDWMVPEAICEEIYRAFSSRETAERKA